MRQVDKLFKLGRALSSDEIFYKNDFFSGAWRDVFKVARTKKASDIHVTPRKDCINVRLRIDGVLEEFKDLPLEFKDQLFARLKEVCHLDVSVTDSIQDRSFFIEGLLSRYRVSVMPSDYGENFVFRVIRDNQIPSLIDLGMDMQAMDDLLSCLKRSQGFICITGPTGSGKSTTLQAAMMDIDRARRNVLSIEDPIEMRIPCVVQTEISDKLTWANAIKAAMRQDPDVIYIGEIRDVESAELAMQAANTGHLVLSTLHTNEASGVVDRLIGLGIERQVIAENLLYVSAQRLVPRLCPACKTEEGKVFTRGKGCEKCDNKGISGRSLVTSHCMKPNPEAIYKYSRDSFNKELSMTFPMSLERLIRKGEVDLELEGLF